MGTAFIHLGVSKTATTTLQHNGLERLNGISFLGKPNPHERERTLQGFSDANSALLERTIESMVEGRNCPRGDIETLRTTIEKLKSLDAPLIYSNELLSENKYISFREIAAGLRDIFGPSELVVTLRNPQTALPSAYMHEMMRFPDNYLCFTKWLDDAIANPRRINRPAESLDQYRYTFMLRQFAEVFDDRIITLQYEELVDNPTGFSRKLARLIGADADEIESLFALPPKNPTRNELYYLYRRLGKKLCSVPLLDLSNLSIAKKLNAAIERWTAKLPKKTVRLSEHDSARIAQYFPYPVDERDWRNDRQGKTGDVISNDKKICAYGR